MTTHQWNAWTLQYLYLVYHSTWQSFTDHQISFANDFLDYMERNINSTGKLLPTGDFNIHVNDLESPDTNMETWIKEDNTTTESQICPPGYKAISVPRSNKQGGGITIVYKDSVTIWRSNGYDYSSMECMDFAVSLPGLSLNLAVIYRPPDKSLLSFATDFLDYMERNINSTGKLLLTGDFNIHVNDLESPDTNTFLAILDSFGLHNHISFPTHHLNNSLDLVIASGQDNLTESSTPGRLFSDHNIVYFNLTTSKQSNNIKETTYRKLKHINMANFNNIKETTYRKLKKHQHGKLQKGCGNTSHHQLY